VVHEVPRIDHRMPRGVLAGHQYHVREAGPDGDGSLNWHSCVEMHWLPVRLLRTVSDVAPAPAIILS
jgi:hypothetical protein